MCRSVLVERRTFEIGHICPHVRVQCIHDHLPVRRPRDLDPPVNQAGRRWGTLPGGIVADVLGLGQEVWEGALVELGLADLAALQQLLASVVERTVQQGKESEGLRSKDLAMLLLDGAEDVDALEDGVGRCHGSVSPEGQCGQVFSLDVQLVSIIRSSRLLLLYVTMLTMF